MLLISLPLSSTTPLLLTNFLPSSRVKRIPSPIPDKKWYLRPHIIALVGGLLPFGSIFIEMYFIFTSFWNYKVGWRCGGGWGGSLQAWGWGS